MKRTRMSWKQILCILLAIIFVTQLVPAPVLAEMVSDTNVSDAQELKLSADTVRKSSPNSSSPSNGNIFCGRYSESSYGVCEMGIQVETLPTVPKNCVVVNAQMSVAFPGLFANYGSAAVNDPNRNITISAYRLKNTSSNFLGLTWNGVYGSGGLGRDSTVLDYKKLNYSNLGGFVSWDVTPAAKEWYNSSNRKGALIFVSENEDSQEVYASFVGHRWYDNSPYFIVNYRNTVGIEDYYTYQTVSAARAGTVHISDYSSNITLINTDVSYSTEAISAEVSHVYNTAYANPNYMLSVAVTREEHQKFTKAWRNAFAYGTDYSKVTKAELWMASKEIYKDYPELLEAARRTIYH